MFSFGLAPGFDPLILLLTALVLDSYVGKLRGRFLWFPAPDLLIGDFYATLVQRLNRPQRSQADRALRGALAALFLILLCTTLGVVVAWLSHHIPFGWIFELLLLLTVLGQRASFDAVRRVSLALSQRGLDAGREELANVDSDDPYRLDRHGVLRVALSALSHRFLDRVVTPVFWYTLFGAPGLMALLAVQVMAETLGRLSPETHAFGMTAVRLDRIFGLLPAAWAGLLMTLAALVVPGANPWRGLVTMVRDQGLRRNANGERSNGGWPEAALAGALNLALGGPRQRRRGVVKHPWIHARGRALAEPQDVSRGLYLFVTACLINGLSLGLLLLARWS